MFALLLAVVVLPVWLFKYFPAWDSPLHLHMADSIANYGRPGYEILTQYLTPNLALEPNLAIYYLLRFCASFSDLYVAEKIFLTLYAVLLAYGARDAVSVINPHASVISLLFIPTVFTMFIHRGFYNFCLEQRALSPDPGLLVQAAVGDDALELGRAHGPEPAAGPRAPGGLRACWR